MRGPAFVKVAALAVAVLLAPAFAGCLEDAAAAAGPLSLLQAYEAAQPGALALAPSAHLVGFVGHEGPAPRFLKGILGTYVEDEDTSFDALRGDGRAYVWVLLFGTYDGGIVRSVVHAEPFRVETRWASNEADPVVQGLWALNLGGRLLTDTPAAIQTVVKNDAAIARHLRDRPDQSIVYASTVTTVDAQGSKDLVHEILFDYARGGDRPYAYYAHVHHFSGFLVDSGDHEKGESLRTVTLVEETFTLGPFAPEAWGNEELERKVFDADMRLVVKGTGSWRFAIERDNQTTVVAGSGQVAQETIEERRGLGTLAPGTYTMHAEATGSVTFGLTIEGVIVL